MMFDPMIQPRTEPHERKNTRRENVVMYVMAALVVAVWFAYEVAT